MSDRINTSNQSPRAKPPRVPYERPRLEAQPRWLLMTGAPISVPVGGDRLFDPVDEH
jgi:hypothetical protein